MNIRRIARPFAVLFGFLVLLAPVSAQAVTPGVATARLAYSKQILSASGAAVGWARGTTSIDVTLSVDKTFVDSVYRKCSNSTSCTTPDLLVTCPRGGKWIVSAHAFGRGGDDYDTKVLVIK